MAQPMMHFKVFSILQSLLSLQVQNCSDNKSGKPVSVAHLVEQQTTFSLK